MHGSMCSLMMMLQLGSGGQNRVLNVAKNRGIVGMISGNLLILVE